MLRKMARTALVASALGHASCSVAVGDLGSFRTEIEACAPGGNESVIRTLRIDLRSMTPHVGDLVVGDVVDREGNLLTRVELDPMGRADVVVEIPNGAPDEPAEFSFYGDVNGDRTLTPLGTPAPDHQWIRPICPDGTMTFVHTAQFEDLRPLPQENGAPFRFTVPDVFRAATKPISVRLERIDESSVAQTVAYYRVPTGASLPVGQYTISGVVDANQNHRVVVLLDHDASGTESEGDFRCETLVRASSAGLDIDFVVADATCTGPRP